MDHRPPTVLPDTNFLLDYPAVHREEWRLPSLEILISETVIAELRGLAAGKRPEAADKARLALEQIEAYQGPMGELTASEYGVRIRTVPRCTELIGPLNPRKPDHQLVAFARTQHELDPPCFCAILSNDQELCDIAEAMTVIAVSRYGSARFHQELQRKYEWWLKAKSAEGALPQRETKPGMRAKREPGREVRLSRTVRRLYRRIAAVGFRTTLFLAPLQARLALALEVIQRLRAPERQVMVIAVRDRETARFWARELRRLGGFPPREIQVFGTDPLERLDKARVVIYRHDQVARRLPQHVSRLEQADKRITALVDGCDLLDPVELAILLYECDQFIGLNHLPIGCRHTRGHRMLNMALRNRSLIDYSFADAERDGWGRSCDLYLSEIAFTPDERELWNEINADYLGLRERAIEQYSDLRGAEDFWDALDEVLDRAAEPELADLIKHREQLERMAQIGRNKLERVKELVHPAPKQPYRRLILDYARQWTPVLLKELSLVGLAAAELPRDEGQRPVWDRFAGNQLDTLLLSDVPALDLPAASLHQLIVLTPLRPMDEILAMVDWALAHTQSSGSLRLDLLYMDDTPEEIAMIELAEASFDLRYL